MFRSDVRENKAGTLLALTVKVVNINTACAAVSGADVEIWHCDVAGDYSQYGSQTAATFLRGIQTTNAAGEVTFTTIYPGWYQGRATHIHVEVTVSGRSVKVTQIAFPEAINNAVHTQGVYASRGANPTSNQSDGIFADSLASELVTPTGSPSAGYSATFQIGVSL
jgi:protocatechuate 3,4-dioxygenase beta subunit